MAIQFDPTKYGATPVVSSNASGFDPSKYKAVRVTPPDSELDNSTFGTIKGIAKNVPSAAKQIIKTAVTNPIKTIQAVTAGAGDVGVGAFNTLMAASDKVSKIAGTKPTNFRLPSLTKAFSEAQNTQEKRDVLGAIGEGSKMYSSFAFGQKGVDKFISNPVLRGVVGNVVGGQMVTDPDASLKDRSTQALFDAAFGAITEGAGPLTKKLFGKKVPPPKEKLTAEQYSASQGYEPIIPDEQLPVIKMGKTPKEPTVKYGKSNPNVFDEGFTAPDGQPPLPTKSVLQDNGKIEAPSVESTPATTTAKETIPVQQSFDDLIKEKATPKFKEEVVELSKQLDEIPGYTPKQKVREAAAFKNYLDSGNEQHLLDVGKGLIKDENLSGQSAFKLLEEHYDKTGQYEKLLDLSKSNVPSQSGQNLSLLNQGEGAGGAASVLSKARIIKEQALLKKGIDVEKEITQHLDDAVKEIKAGKDVNSVIDDLIDSFTCI